MDRKSRLQRGELSDGCRLGVGSNVNKSFVNLTQCEAESKLNTHRHPSLFVYTFVSSLQFVDLHYFLQLFVESKSFSICPPYGLRCHTPFSNHLFLTLFTILAFAVKGLSKHLREQQRLKAFTAAGLSSLSFCGLAESKESCSCTIASLL